jgi:KaiC/GvpD/RAD55 family RecA-like ATPase
MSGTVSTGISELDQRLGGLASGRYYLLTGTPGAGKTSACLHFVAEGLRHGETCAILTQENADDLFAQATFIGHDFQSAAEDGSLIVLQYRLDFSNNYSRVGNSQVVARELIAAFDGAKPARLVADSILPFVQTGGMGHGATTALLQVMEELAPTAYFTVPGDLGDSFYARLYDPLVSGTAGILHFEMAGDVRELTIRKLRQTPVSTEPLRFLIRGGLGIVELDDSAPAIADGEDGRVALVNSGGRLGGELFASMERAYALDIFDSTEAAQPNVSNGYSMIVLVVDPIESDKAISFLRSVRRFSGVPIVMIAPSEGLRSSTRTRAVRAGADEFLAIEGSAQELLSRLEAARARGHRNTAERLKRERLLVQPRSPKGAPLVLPEEEIVRAVRHHLGTSEHPFFAVVRLRPPADAVNVAWEALSQNLRLGDGDLVAKGDRQGEWVVYLHDISRRHARELIARAFSADPRLESTDVAIDHFPADGRRIEAWLNPFVPAAMSPPSQQLGATG